MIRVVTYNMSGALHVGAMAEVLATLQPDVVCAVEVPRRLSLHRLARRANLEVAARAGRGRLRVAVLTGERTHMVCATQHDLPVVPGMPLRSVAQAIVTVSSTKFAAFAVQLGLRPEVREMHGQTLEEVFGKVSAPLVVGADLNEAPNGKVVSRLSRSLQDAYRVAGEGDGGTYPSPEPMSRKDFLFVDPTLRVLRSWVPDEPAVGRASHHRPVVAEIADQSEMQPVRGAPAAAWSGAEPAA